MDINQKLTEELDVNRWQIDAAVTLIDEGNTIPFISRYRKEATGSICQRFTSSSSVCFCIASVQSYIITKTDKTGQ